MKQYDGQCEAEGASYILSWVALPRSEIDLLYDSAGFYKSYIRAPSFRRWRTIGCPSQSDGRHNITEKIKSGFAARSVAS